MLFAFPNLENKFSIGTEENSDLMTTTTVSVKEVEAKIFNLIKEIKLKNSPETVVSILGGTHGGNDGASGFSFMPHIEHPTYPGPEIMKDYKDIISELKKDPACCKITFQLYDMIDYHFCDPKHYREGYPNTSIGKPGCLYKLDSKDPNSEWVGSCKKSGQNFESQTKELIADLTGKGKNLVWKWKSGSNPSKERGEKTTYLALGWCHSFYGDVNLALRSNAEMSRLIIETNMKNIGIEEAELSKEQKEFLEKATNKNIKDLYVEGK